MATAKQILMQRLRSIGSVKTASVRQSNGLLDLLINAGHAINQHHKTAGGPLGGLPLTGGMPGLGLPGVPAAPAAAPRPTRPAPTGPQPTAAQMQRFSDHMSNPDKTGLVPDQIMAARQISDQARRGGSVPKMEADGTSVPYRYRPTWSPAYQQQMAKEQAFSAGYDRGGAPSATPSGGKGLSIVEALGGGQ